MTTVYDVNEINRIWRSNLLILNLFISEYNRLPRRNDIYCEKK